MIYDYPLLKSLWVLFIVRFLCSAANLIHISSNMVSLASVVLDQRFSLLSLSLFILLHVILSVAHFCSHSSSLRPLWLPKGTACASFSLWKIKTCGEYIFLFSLFIISELVIWFRLRKVLAWMNIGFNSLTVINWIETFLCICIAFLPLHK